MTTLPSRLEALAAAHAERTAVIAAQESVSFARLANDARTIASGLADLGVSKGTRVGLLMPNRPDWLRCAFAIWRLGAIVVPINTLLRPPELAHALRHADITVLIAVASFLKHDYQATLSSLCPELQRPRPLRSSAFPCLRHVVIQGTPRPPGALDFETTCSGGTPAAGDWLSAAAEAVVPSDDAAVFFTSGSTAAPKGVVHTHASMLQAADNVGDRLGLTSDDRTWGYLPFFFNGGLVAVALATLSRGAAILVQEVFEPAETLAALEQYRCTTFFAWPHQAEALSALPQFDRSRLALHKGVGANTKWAARIYPPNHQAVATWGMTETGPMAASTRYDDPLPQRVASHGRAMPGLDIRIVDPESGAPVPTGTEGEIVVRGTSLMRTYYRNAASDCVDAQHFFHTGDCGRLDETGHLHFIGRIKDVIKTAGVNVAAAEVEAVLLTHPTVKVAHVVPVPHPSRGENVAAFVVARDDRCSEADILAHCRAQLASYKVPRHLFVCREEDLPTLGSGKIDRQALRQRAARSVEAENQLPHAAEANRNRT